MSSTKISPALYEKLAKSISSKNTPQLLETLPSFIPGEADQYSLDVLLDIVALWLELAATDKIRTQATILRVLNGRGKKLPTHKLYSKYAKTTFPQETLNLIISALIYTPKGYLYGHKSVAEFKQIESWLTTEKAKLPLGCPKTKSTAAPKQDFTKLTKHVTEALHKTLYTLPDRLLGTELTGVNSNTLKGIRSSHPFDIWCTRSEFVSRKKEPYGFSTIRRLFEHYPTNGSMHYVYGKFAVKSTGAINLICLYSQEVNRTTYKLTGAIVPMPQLTVYMQPILDGALN